MKTIAQVRDELRGRAAARRNPFDRADPEEALRIVDALESVEEGPWVSAFADAGRGHERLALEAERAGHREAAAREAGLAYAFHRVARYPAPTTAAKRAEYRVSQRWYLELAREFDPPLERVRIPFDGRSGEGREVVADLRVPRAGARPPVAIVFGGIDSFKEERRVEAILGRGVATLSVDMPGVADAPIAGSIDAERLWDPVLDWLERRPDVDGARVGVYGGSTGGYWAAKLAHTHRHRLRAAVCQGGAIHHAFSRDWIERAEDGEYPFALAETLAAAFGLRTREEWIANAPRLSLLDQNVLDRPCAPLLLVNGVRDSVFPIADMHLLLEHGGPKTARFYAGGHMGGGDPSIPGLIADWLAERLA